MGGGELAGGKKWTAYFGAKGLPSVYSGHTGAPTYSKEGQAVSCSEVLLFPALMSLGKIIRSIGSTKFLLMILLLFCPGLKTLRY